MSFLLAAKEPWVKKVISIAGATDLVASANERPEMQEVFNESFGGSEEEMQKRSVVEFYPEIPTDLPILIIQGAADDRVSVGQARKLNHLLSESGHQVEYHEFADGDHILHPHKKEVSEILSHFLKDQK